MQAPASDRAAEACEGRMLRVPPVVSDSILSSAPVTDPSRLSTSPKRPRGQGDQDDTDMKNKPSKGYQHRGSNDGGGGGASACGNPILPDPPKYEAGALARVVFADPYFYDDMADTADLCASKRDAAFGETTTVDDVFGRYMRDATGVADLVRAIKATDTRLVAYYAAAITAEHVLDGKTIAVLGDVQEVRHYQRAAQALDLPTLDRVFHQHETETRTNRLCIVTGSSGSGKTYFCLHYLSRFLRDPNDRTLTVYLHPSGLQAAASAASASSRSGDRDGTALGQELVERVREQIAEEYGHTVTAALRMHVCLVFDEAGALDLGHLFEEPAVLTVMCAYLMRHLARKVVVVVSGTGITGRNFQSKTEAYFFRMPPWDAADLTTLVEKRQGDLHLKAGEAVPTVVNAILAHPKLCALTTNARSAHFLVEAVVSLCSVHVQEDWRVQMEAWAPAIVTKAVHGYIAESSIPHLRRRQRALVAACVFRALDETKLGRTDLPQFPLLQIDEEAIATAFLTYHVERDPDRENATKLLDDEEFAISVTPAIAIVLFTMAGLQVSMVPGRRAEEEVVGLHAARRLMLRRLESHVNAHGGSKVDALKDSLEGIRLYALQGQIQAPRRVPGREGDVNVGKVRVPLVPPESVLLNGTQSSFADVIAPYMLLQSRPGSDGVVAVDLEKELDRCCLLKTCKDDRVLRGMLALWKGDLRPITESRELGTVNLPYRNSNAYPENLVQYGAPSDVVDYASIESLSTDMTLADRRLGFTKFGELGTKVTFVLVTNATTINVTDVGLTITHDLLTDRLQLDTTKLTGDLPRAWASFTERVQPWVTIEFLFAMSSRVNVA
jgi:Uncharacterized conserved protein (DUF2075)